MEYIMYRCCSYDGCIYSLQRCMVVCHCCRMHIGRSVVIMLLSIRGVMSWADPEGVHWVPVNPPPVHIKQEKFLLCITSKNASSLLLCLPI